MLKGEVTNRNTDPTRGDKGENAKTQKSRATTWWAIQNKKKKKKNRQSFGEGHQDIVIDKTGKNKKYEDLGYSGVA